MSSFREDVLKGKTAFVTGGGSGICRGITKALMAHGVDAVITSRKQERLDEASKALADETGQRCLGVACDVREPETVESAIDAALEAMGKIDIVVNGAAGNFLSPAAQLSYNAFKTVVDIDTVGTFNVSRAAFHKALKAQKSGSIINISATLHYGATPLQAHAAAAKAAVDSITRSLALEWGKLGIRVNGIAPGPIDGTEGMSRLAPGEMKEKVLKTIPIGRMGTIDEIANVALFLCTPAASLIHGETIVADGGSWLGGSALALMM